MPKFLLVYYGGATQQDPAAAEQSMKAWVKWFEAMGKAVVDAGNPTMPGKVVSAKGVKDGAIGEPITGYSIITADSVDAVAAQAKKSPHLTEGGRIAVYTISEVMPKK